MRTFNPQVIVITGASGSIGAALAERYAGLGITLILQGRDESRLQRVQKNCESLGAEVVLMPADLAIPESARVWMRLILEETRPDLVIFNAGMNTNVSTHHGISGEDWQASDELIHLNLVAVMGMADLVARFMQQRQYGQMVFISSLAGYFGLPVTPSYCASKAGLKAYAEALRGGLAHKGVRVNVVMPGYVSSPMCDAMLGPKTFEMSPERAAAIIHNGLARNKARISFPFPLNFGTWWLAVLPASVSTWLVRLMGYGVK
ncbi:MAG TPA: SDR family NAD(P)-dependent oxidoreductase [Halothiobacillus sp.]|nr:SDR family NAD(P)-dependent oxidoreductase [Halothiobacillus sp.]